jgi:hypothetical protein
MSLAEILLVFALSALCTQAKSSSGHGNDNLQSPEVASNGKLDSLAPSPSIASSLYKQ